MWWLIPVAIIGGVVYLTKKDKGLSGVPVAERTHKPIDLDIKDLSASKAYITRRINDISRSARGFKIGKSGQPNNRVGSYDYKHSDELAKSKDKKLIASLEALYIDKYFNHPKCENINKGSAGKMETDDGYYYLYIVTR